MQRNVCLKLLGNSLITKLLSVIQLYWAPIGAILVAVIAGWAAICYAAQPLLECFGFRQTQTALTSYWMMMDGWKLAYETPVAGYPWAIPMEFPIYQSLVASIAYWGNLPLDPVGRLVSYCFLLACVWPALAITRRLQFKSQVAWVFCALLWSSPLYLFWGRTFMIETAAVFFTLAAIPYAIELFEASPRWISTFLFAFFATLGMLQKVTTTLPVLVVLALVLLVIHVKSCGFKLPTWHKSACVAVAFSIPLVISILWINYSDYLKAQNLLGVFLTSKALNKWNFGTLNQRFDFTVLKTIFWDRLLLNNAAGFLGITILGISLFIGTKRARTIILINLVMFVLPIFIFINLHFIHAYYQISSTIFLMGALAVAITVALPERVGKLPLSPIMTILLIGCNLYFFSTGYAHIMRLTFDASKTEILAIGDVIRRYTPKESGMVIFGADWSSEIGYYSERKSFTVPHWPVPQWEKVFNAVWQAPANFIGEQKLGAVVFCTSGNHINLADILARPDIQADPCLYNVHEAYVWLPGVTSISLSNSHSKRLPMDFLEAPGNDLPAGYTEALSTTHCDGTIDIVNGIFPAPAELSVSGSLKVDGWLAVSVDKATLPEAVYVVLTDSQGKHSYFRTRQTLRPDVGDYFKKSKLNESGYTVTADVSKMVGQYTLGLAIKEANQIKICPQFKITVTITKR